MMSKQVLSIEQMQHLQELGLELKDAMIYWSKPHKGVICRCGNDWFLSFADDKTRKFFEVIPAYTLQDVLDLLPKQIGIEYIYELYIFPDSISYTQFIGGEINDTLFEVPINGSLIDAAYNLLCWAIEQGYVETNKNE